MMENDINKSGGNNVDKKFEAWLDEIVSDKRAEGCDHINVILGSDTVSKTSYKYDTEYKSFTIKVYEAPKDICSKMMVVYAPKKEEPEIVYAPIAPVNITSNFGKPLSFYNEAGLKTYGDWATLNKQYLGRITIDNIKPKKKVIYKIPKFFKWHYKFHISDCNNVDSIKVYDAENINHPFIYKNSGSSDFTVEKYKCKFYITHKKGNIVVHLNYPFLWKMRKGLYHIPSTISIEYETY